MADTTLNAELNFEYASVAGMRKAIKEAKDEVLKLMSAGKNASEAMKTLAMREADFKKFNGAIRQSAVGMQKTQMASANAGVALMNLNYVIRDSPYFFNNFALGVLAVGNNINPLIDSFARLRAEAGEKSVTTFTLLKKALVGGAGISIAFSIVVTVIQAFVFQMSKAKGSTQDLTQSMKALWSETYKAVKAWDEFILALDKMSKTDVEESLKAITKELEEGKPKFVEWLALVLNLGNGLETLGVRMAELVRKQTALKDAVNGKKEGVVGGGLIEQQEALVESYKILAESAKTDEERVGWIKLYNEAQEELNRLWGKTKEKTEKQVSLYKQMEVLLGRIQSKHERILRLIQMQLEAGVKADPFSEYNLQNDFGMVGGQKVKNPMEQTIKQINDELLPAFKNIEQIANIAGNAISNAFLTGKNVIEAATQALLQFVVQLLVVKGLAGLLGFAFGGAPGAALAISGAGAIGKSSNGNFGGRGSALKVSGKIYADKNNFIADIKNAENYYDRNEGFVVIGR